MYLQMKNLKKINQDDDSDSELEDDEDEGTQGQPIVSSAAVRHPGCVNRIRVGVVTAHKC